MSDARLPDGLLLRRYRERGDEAAFAELRGRYERLVLATCRRETGDPALAEDAAQGVFLLLIRKSFGDEASLAGWLHGAARLVSKNAVREEIRRRRRERRAFETFERPEEAWNAISPHIDAALGSLKAEDREAVLLRFGGDMSLAEVAKALGVAENAARMRVSRAVERMRTQLRRAGIGITAALLVALLSTRLAEAKPLPPVPPSERAQRLASQAKTAAVAPVLLRTVALLTIAGGVGYVASATFVPHRLDAVETRALFSQSAGTWTGTLEFADDATGQRTKTPTTVVVTHREGGLRLVVTYPSFRNVDTMTITSLGDRYRVENGGPGSSHALDGTYDLIRLPREGPAFVGDSSAVRGEVRLHLDASPSSLTIKEEYRRTGDFRFRNRFDLRRTP